MQIYLRMYNYICIYSLNNGVVCVEGHGATQLNTTEMWTPMKGISKGQPPRTQNEQIEQVISIVNSLPETNIAHENSPFWLYLPGKMAIFMGYVSFREGIYSIFKNETMSDIMAGS